MVIKYTQLNTVIRAAPQFWEWGYKTMLGVEPAEFFFYPSLVTFWGTLVANDAKIVHFYLLHNIFYGGTAGHEGSPLDTPLCGVEWSGSENWMSGSGAWRDTVEREQSRSGKIAEQGVTERGVSVERKFWPLMLLSHALPCTAMQILRARQPAVHWAISDLTTVTW